MSWFGGRNDRSEEEEERITETYTSTDYDRGYNNYGRGPREDERRFTETTSSTYYDSDNNNNRPPPPQVEYPWLARWDDREGRYYFVHDRTGERSWEFPGRRGGGYQETETTTTYYDERGGGGRYGGQQEERMYHSENVVQEDRRRAGGGHGHGLAYGALGAAAGLAGGAFLAHEAGNIEGRFERDRYRVEKEVEDFPENAAEWTGRKVGEVEGIPQDIEQGFDRFGNRIEQGFEDVVDAPEEMANWAGRKVGDVERFDDNIDNAYDEGKYEGRNEDRW